MKTTLFILLLCLLSLFINRCASEEFQENENNYTTEAINGKDISPRIDLGVDNSIDNVNGDVKEQSNDNEVDESLFDVIEEIIGDLSAENSTTSNVTEDNVSQRIGNDVSNNATEFNEDDIGNRSGDLTLNDTESAVGHDNRTEITARFGLMDEEPVLDSNVTVRHRSMLESFTETNGSEVDVGERALINSTADLSGKIDEFTDNSNVTDRFGDNSTVDVVERLGNFEDNSTQRIHDLVSDNATSINGSDRIEDISVDNSSVNISARIGDNSDNFTTNVTERIDDGTSENVTDIAERIDDNVHNTTDVRERFGDLDVEQNSDSSNVTEDVAPRLGSELDKVVQALIDDTSSKNSTVDHIAFRMDNLLENALNETTQKIDEIANRNGNNTIDISLNGTGESLRIQEIFNFTDPSLNSTLLSATQETILEVSKEENSVPVVNLRMVNFFVEDNADVKNGSNVENYNVHTTEDGSVNTILNGNRIEIVGDRHIEHYSNPSNEDNSTISYSSESIVGDRSSNFSINATLSADALERSGINLNSTDIGERIIDGMNTTLRIGEDSLLFNDTNNDTNISARISEDLGNFTADADIVEERMLNPDDNTTDIIVEERMFNPDDNTTEIKVEERILNPEGNTTETIVEERMLNGEGNTTEIQVEERMLNGEGNTTEIQVEERMLNGEGNTTEIQIEERMLNGEGNTTEIQVEERMLNGEGNTTEIQIEERMLNGEGNTTEIQVEERMLNGEGNTTEIKVEERILNPDGNTTEIQVEERILNGEGNTTEIKVEERILNPDGNTTEILVEERMLNPEGNSTEIQVEERILNSDGNTTESIVEERMLNGEDNTTENAIEERMVNPDDTTSDCNESPTDTIIEDSKMTIVLPTQINVA